MSCSECQRVTEFMACDPEMYRDEPRLCEAHLEIERLRGVEHSLRLRIDTLSARTPGGVDYERLRGVLKIIAEDSCHAYAPERARAVLHKNDVSLPRSSQSRNQAEKHE